MNKKRLSGRVALSVEEKELKATYSKMASDWLKAEILRSGISRKEIATKLSRNHGREISENKLNQMLNKSFDAGLFFEICEIIETNILGLRNN